MTYDANKLVSVYVKIRDAKDKLTEKYEKDKAKLDAQLTTIETELLNICKATGQDGGKTSAGTFTRSVKSRYWSSDWAAMSRFIREHDAIDLLEQRIHQTNMRTFLSEHPNLIPEGLNVDSKYTITVRRARS
jgi:hypothetical protein